MDKRIINILLDKYERSKHITGGGGRSVILRPTELPEYDSHDYRSVKVFTDAVQKLEQKNLVSAEAEKYIPDLIACIRLNLDNIQNVYIYAGRKPLLESKRQLLDITEKALKDINTEWIRNYLKTENTYINERSKPDRFFFDEPEKAETLCSVLEFVSNSEPTMMRNISVQCFNDSKYLERNLKSKLISIAKRYEPNIVEYHSAGGEMLTDSEVLEQIGIIQSSEIFEFCGNAVLVINGTNTDISCFKRGFCLHSETVPAVEKITLRDIKTVLFVENHTTYRQLVINKIPDDMFIIYHGGFYSPLRGLLFKKLYNSNPLAEYFFWGDIDLGGFMMYDRLKSNIIPSLKPYRMDIEAYRLGVKYGIKRNADYCARLSAYAQGSENCKFKYVIDAILQTEKTVEQEIFSHYPVFSA